MKNHIYLFSTIIVTMLFLVIPGRASSQTTFEKHTLCTNFTQGTEVHACDINQDGNMDFLASGNRGGGQVLYWENNGYHDFIEHIVDDDIDWARSVGAGDLNEDGEMDIVVAAYGANTVRWYENDGNENWTIHDIDNQFIGAHTVDVKDVNDDGRLDVLCSSFDNGPDFSEIAWWENMPDTNWTKHVISTRFQQSPFIYGEDIDGDGDMDILACGELNGEVYWWENDGSQNWTEHMIDDNFSMAHTVHARDIDLDGDMDIIGAACMSSSLAWWENDGSEYFTKHPMGVLNGALWFDAVDLDNDGDRDLYAGGQGATRLVRWENDGNSNFTRHNFNTTFSQTFSVVHADFNNDSDTDLVAIGFNNHTIAWFDNEMLGPDLYDRPECVVFDQENNRYLVANYGNGCIIETDTTNNQKYFNHGYGHLFGMCLVDETLFGSDGDTLFGFSLETGELEYSLFIPALNNLDGMTTDENGFLYVIDTGGKMYKVDIEGHSYEVLVPSGLPSWPQDCVYDPFNDRIVVAAYQASSPIVSVDPETGEIITLVSASPGRYDGITIDQEGNFYFGSHYSGGRVYRYDNNFSGSYEVIATSLGEPTGLNYNQQDNILAVPCFSQDTVHFIKITTVGIEENGSGDNFDLNFSPNPCYGTTRLMMYDPTEKYGCILKIHDNTGRLIEQRISANTSKKEVHLDVNSYSPGIYLVSLISGNTVVTKKLIVM